MKLLVRLIFLVVVLLIIAVAVAAFAISRLDPNDYKAQISQTVLEKTGRDLTITGDIDWSLFPWLGLEVGRASLGNAEGFAEPNFAAIDEMAVHVKLMPLLRKRVEVDKVHLQGVTLNLERDASGNDNWSDIADAVASDEQAASEEPSIADELELSVGEVAISDTNISFRDRQAGSELLLGPVNLHTGRIALGEAIPLDLDAQMSVNSTTRLNAKLSGTVTADPENEVLKVVASLNAKLDQALGENEVSSDLSGDLSADAYAGQYEIKGLDIQGDFVSAAFPSGLPMDLQADVTANTNSQQMSLEKLRMKVADLVVNGRVEVENFIDSPAFSGNLTGESFNPRAVMESLGMAVPLTRSDKALSRGRFNLGFSGNTNRVVIEPLTATLDESELEGRFAIESFKAQRMRFDLAIDQFNADDYLPPVTAEGAKASDVDVSDMRASAGATSSGANDAILLPLEAIRALDVAGSARLGELVYNRLLFTDASLKLNARNGLLEVAPLVANAYQGKATISASLDARGNTPVYSVDFDLGGLRSEEVLMVLFGEKYLSGAANLKIKANTSGNTVSQLKGALAGEYDLRFNEGTIHGSKLAGKLLQARNAIRKLRGLPPVEDKTPDATEFTSLTASGPITDGVLQNDNLKLLSPHFDISGKGNARFVDNTLDYTLRLALRHEEGEDGYYLPLRIHGPFTDLGFTLKLEELAKQRLEVETDKIKDEAKEKLEEEKQKAEERLEAEKEKAEEKLEEKKKEVEEEIKDKLGDELGGALGGLFGRDRGDEKSEESTPPAEEKSDSP